MADYSPIYNRKIYNTDANSDLYLKTFVTTEDNTKSKSAYYTIVLEDKDKTKSLAYSVLTGSDKDLTAAYSVNLDNNTKSKSAYYTIVLEDKDKTKSLAYSVLTGSDKDLTAAYSVNLDNNTKSKSLAFSVVMLKEPDYTSSYEVLASNTESRTSSYEVLVEDNTANKTLGYNVMTPDSYKQKTITYNVKLLYDIGKSVYYGVLLNKDKDVTSTFDLSYMYDADYSSYYSVKDTLSVSKVCSFSTLLASNTESRTSSYEVLVEDNTANKTLGYNVMTPDSYKQKTITYNVKPLYDIDKSVYYGVLLNKDKDVTSTFDLSYMYDADYSSYYSVKDTLSISKVCSFSTLSEVGIYTVFSEIQHPVVTGDSSVFVEDTSLFEVSDYVYLIDTAGTYQLVGLTAVNDYNLVFSPAANIDIINGIVLLNEPTLITGDTDITNYVFSKKTNPNLYVGIFINEVGFIDIVPKFSGYTALTDLNVNMDSTLQLFKLKIDDGGQILPYSKELDLKIQLTIVDDNTLNSNPYALNFDGVNDYVNIPNDLFTSLSDFTIELWVCPQDNGNKNVRYVSLYSTDVNIQVGDMQTTHEPYMRINGTSHKSAISPISLNMWQHLAFVYSSGTVRIYKNGEEIATILGGITSDTLFSAIGAGGSSPTIANYKGKLDEIRIWNTARTADQIAHNRNVRLTGNEMGLVGYWRLDEGVGTSTVDSSVSENTGIITGATWIEGEIGLSRDYTTDSSIYVVDLKEKLLRTMFQYNINEMKDYNNIIRYNEFISNNLTIPDYLEDDLDTLTYYDYTLDTVTLSDKTIVDNIYVFFKAYDFSNIVLANVEIDSIEYKASLVSSSNILDYVTKNPNTVMLFMSGDFIYLYLPSYIPVTNSIYLNIYKESA